ncbi:AlpA family phage regulatory protein [Microbulbifer aggregans]|uniref:helix-turn-helix transcriptional regulator n=1 Tax=Microbulbifer aggregans TaxID=1769779 RepID=UPI001CFC715B
MPQPDKLLRLPAVLQIIPVSRSTWYSWISDGHAPKPIKLGTRTSVWRESDIQNFIYDQNQKGAIEI